MYFPYLRGRQYELLAIRELGERELIGNQIIPIIEPIKLSPTLIKTVDSFVEKGKEIAIIHNPQVGKFSNDIDDIEKNDAREKYLNILTNKYVIKSHILNQNTEIELNELHKQGIQKPELLLINGNKDCLNIYAREFGDEKPRYNLIPDESGFRRNIKVNRVLFDDKFEKQERNTDYANRDEFFSEDHLYYNTDGYVGFSDYSIVGNGFTEGGFAPYAVAIHIVYFDEEKRLRMKHFVSDSNEDISNPAKKFYEALTKLADWQEEAKLETYGILKLMEHYHEKTYPGLGSVKKLAVMHHIELISKYLDEVK